MEKLLKTFADALEAYVDARSIMMYSFIMATRKKAVTDALGEIISAARLSGIAEHENNFHRP